MALLSPSGLPMFADKWLQHAIFFFSSYWTIWQLKYLCSIVKLLNSLCKCEKLYIIAVCNGIRTYFRTYQH